MKVKFKVPACLSPACARGVGWCSLKRKSCQDQLLCREQWLTFQCLDTAHVHTCQAPSGYTDDTTPQPAWESWEWNVVCAGGLGGQNVHVTKYGKCTVWWCWWAPACNSVLW